MSHDDGKVGTASDVMMAESVEYPIGLRREDRQALEAFVVENADLETLEGLLEQFNIFEAVGVVRQELRHSDFLAYLLDPKENHGLEDSLVKELLRRVLVTAGDIPVSVAAEELEQWDLIRVEVRREWQFIDILLLDEDHELAVIIENKIDTIEHSGQLKRYYEIVEQYYPGWRVIAMYLTPSGDPPSHECYLPMDYGLVCDVIDNAAKGSTSIVNADVKTLMVHYTDMLRRNIVKDSDIAKLCRKIYQKHSRALDLIYEHRPDPQRAIRDLLISLIRSQEGLIYKGSTSAGRFLSFWPERWQTPYGSLNFVLHNLPGELDLFIEVSWADEEARRRLFDVARNNRALFGDFIEKPGTGLNPKLYRRTFLTRSFYEEASEGNREEEIRRHWEEFLRGDLREIKKSSRTRSGSGSRSKSIRSVPAAGTRLSGERVTRRSHDDQGLHSRGRRTLESSSMGTQRR